MLRKVFEGDGNCFLQLWIVPLAHCLWILINDNVRVDTVVLDIPFSFR